MISLPSRMRLGAARLVLLRVIFLIGCFALGGQKLYTWLRNREITSLPLAEYLAKKPEAEWLELKAASLDLLASAGAKQNGQVKSLYIPLTPRQSDEDEPIQVLLHTKDPAYLSVLEEMKALRNAEETRVYVLKNMDRVKPTKEVRGLIEFGAEESSKHREQLVKLDLNLAKDFVVLADGAKPEPLFGAGLCVGGLILLGTFVVRRRAPSGSAWPSESERSPLSEPARD